MNESKISVRYAKALFRSALEKKVLDEVNKDMVFISSVCASEEFKDFLNNPVIDTEAKKKVMSNIFEKNVGGITMSLINLVIKNGRESFLPAIARVFRSDTLRYMGITECLLTTAVKIDGGIKKQISDLVASGFKTKVEFKENIDSEIIGGFILRVDDKYIDASIRYKLRKIKKELISGNISI